MSIPGFDAAQAAYDARMPPEYPIFTCPISGESNEDCEREGHECEDAAQDDDPSDYEPDDLDDYRHGMGRYAPDYHLDD